MRLNKLSPLALGAAALLTAAAACPADAELLTNTSFEDDFTGYSAFGPGFRFGVDADANTGDQGLVNDVLTTDPAGSGFRGVFQAVPGTPGDGYTFSGFIRGVSLDNTEAFLKLEFLDASNAVIAGTESARVIADQPFTLTAIPEQIAPAGTATVQVLGFVSADLDNLTDGDFVIFDDFSLTSRVIPEPATAGLIGLGLLGLTARRRRA